MNSTYIGNAIIIIDEHNRVLLGRKKPKDKADTQRKRKRVGIGCWVPPGGATEPNDKSEVHSAQRETREETGIRFPLAAFKKVGELQGFLDGSVTPTWLVHLFHVICLRPNLLTPNVEEFDDMQWFVVSELPFKDMIAGDRKWLPRIARGEKLSIAIKLDTKANKASLIKIKPYYSHRH